MSSHDEFVHVFTGPTPPQDAAWPGVSTVSQDFFANAKAQRVFTEGLIIDKIRKEHPKYHLTVNNQVSCDLLAWANSQDADVSIFPHGDDNDGLVERAFVPPSRRYGDENGGGFADKIVFGVWDLMYKGDAFLVYTIEGSVGPPYVSRYNYILVEDLTLGMVESKVARMKTDSLLKAATKWMQELHGEILVFDMGYWQKNKELYDNVQKSRWEDVILEKEKKDGLREDVIGFFDAEKRYAEFGVPWKRGLIFYGPPGNGKTISTKALMHDVSKRISPAVESLYVKTLAGYAPPEYSIRNVFVKARQLAPCLLIFEDIDSLIGPGVRSYFLNEVDGLESNHGILMIGSTNHLERLDPGIAKRPSRFDRKVFFDNPDHGERVQYCDYWRKKLSGNKEIDFPEELSARVADITDNFSFAYLKEAFVAALLVIVRAEKRKLQRDDDLSKNVLWKELKRQIESLRKEMEDGDGEDAVAMGRLTSCMSGMWPALGNMSDERSSRFGERRAGPMEIRDANSGMPRYF